MVLVDHDHRLPRAGEELPLPRSRFYDIARGSAHESGAIWDVAKLVGLLDKDSYAKGKTLLQRIVSMLVRMVER